MHDVVDRPRLQGVDVSVGKHVVRRRDHRGQVVGDVTNRGKGFEARHAIRVPWIARRRAEEERGTCLSSPSDDEVGGLQSAIRSERSEQFNAAWTRYLSMAQKSHTPACLSTRNTAVIEVGKDEHVFLMRVTLPDRPGSLGSVATAMGSVGADINAVEIVEKKSEGSVVDDFIVDLAAQPAARDPGDRLPEPDWCTRGVDCALSRGGGLQSDLEALERMTVDPPHAAETLVSLCPVVFRSHWATLIEVSDGAPRPRFSTTLAPDLTPEIAARFTPFDTTHRTDLDADWSPGWGDTTAVVTPLTGDRVIVIGRLGVPPFSSPRSPDCIISPRS